MAVINRNFSRMPEKYLFTETAYKAERWIRENPGRRLLRLGVGDASLPIPKAVAKAMAGAAAELAEERGFRGYGPEQGYDFLRNAIVQGDYLAHGISIDPDEVFVSDGAKTDCGGILDLFDAECTVALCDPVYPAYVDALAISGRAGNCDSDTGKWNKLVYLPCLEENGFFPALPEERVDVVYLCFPNNPTGAAATKTQLSVWVNWANDTGAVILFDGAYHAFISGTTVPHSIYEVDGAEECAIELRSFSKTAGFTGVRCSYTVIPEALVRNGVSLNALWRRRQAARFNGVSYVVQRGAEALYTEEGISEIKACIEKYRSNANILLEGAKAAGLTAYGGVHAPYIWLKTPDGVDSWSFFECLLKRGGILTTPGVGFGSCGQGYIRLSAFCKNEDACIAAARLKELI